MIIMREKNVIIIIGCVNSKLKFVYASINLLRIRIEMVCNRLMVMNSVRSRRHFHHHSFSFDRIFAMCEISCASCEMMIAAHIIG